MTVTQPIRPGTSRWASRAFLVVCALSLLVLLSWITGWWEIWTFGHNYVPMAPSTALLFGAVGVAGLVRQRRGSSPSVNRFVLAVAFVVSLTGASVLLQQWLGTDLPTLARTDDVTGGFPVGRMSPLTAVGFLLAGLSLAFRVARRRRLRHIAAALALATALFGTIVILNYTLGSPLHHDGTMIPMAIPTAVAFVVLAAGLVLACGADTWPLNLFVHADHPDPRKQRAGVLALLLVGVALIVTMGVSYIRHERDHSRLTATEIISAIADLQVAQIASWRAERLAHAETIRQTPLGDELHAFMTGPEDGTARHDLLVWLRALREAYGYASASLVDGDGIIRLGQFEDDLPVDPESLDSCRKALRENRVVLSHPFRSPSGDRLFMALAIPFRSAGNGLVVLLRIDAERHLFSLLRKWPTPSLTGETLIVRQESDEIVFLNELRHGDRSALDLRIPMSRAPTMPATRAVAGFEGVVEGPDYRGEPVIAVVRKVPETPWFLVAKIDLEEIDAPFRSHLGLTILAGLLLLLATGAGVSVLWYRKGLHSVERELEIERRLRESERSYRALFDQAAVGVVQVELSTGRIVAANQRYCEITGYPDDAVASRPFLDMVLAEDRDHVRESLQRLVEGKVRELSEECRYNRRDGSVRWVRMTLTPLWSPGDEPADCVGIVRDVTDQKHAEDEVTVLNRELEDRVVKRTAQLDFARREQEAFSYSVSHDLRAPLRGIDGWSAALLEDCGDRLDDKGREYLGRVRSETQKMGLLIDDLLQLSRLTRQEMSVSPVDLSALARKIASRLRENEPGRDVELVVEDGLVATCDAGLMEIVLTNLLDNAWKFTGNRPSARIAFGCNDVDGKRHFFVRDNGAGFDMQYASRLFAPFQRMHRASEFPGTGIGLATVQRIIHRHGGTIRAESEPERGTTFHFTLEIAS